MESMAAHIRPVEMSVGQLRLLTWMRHPEDAISSMVRGAVHEREFRAIQLASSEEQLELLVTYTDGAATLSRAWLWRRTAAGWSVVAFSQRSEGSLVLVGLFCVSVELKKDHPWYIGATRREHSTAVISNVVASSLAMASGSDSQASVKVC